MRRLSQQRMPVAFNRFPFLVQGIEISGGSLNVLHVGDRQFKLIECFGRLSHFLLAVEAKSDRFPDTHRRLLGLRGHRAKPISTQPNPQETPKGEKEAKGG